LGEGWAVGRFPGQFLRRTELIKRSLRLDDEPTWWCREPLHSPSEEEELNRRRRRLDRQEAPRAVSKKDSRSYNGLMNASSESSRAAEKAAPSRAPCGTPTPLTCGGVWGKPAGLARRARPSYCPCSWGGTSCPPPPRGPGILGETLSRPLVAVSTEGGNGNPSPPPPPSLAVPRTLVDTRARPST